MSLWERIARGVKATFAANVIKFVANVVILVLLTRVFLTPEEYGRLFLAISVFSVAGLLATLGIGKSAARYLTDFRKKETEQIHHILTTSIAFLSVTTAIVSVSLGVFAPQIASVFDEPGLEPLILVGMLYVVFKAASSYLRLSFQGFGRVPLSAVQRIVTKAGELLFITLFLALGFGEIGALWGFLGGMAIGVVVGTYLLYRIAAAYPSTGSIEPGLRRRIAEYSVPLAATKSANILYKRVDTLMIGFFLSPVAVGFYELAKQVAMAVQAPASSLGFTVAPTYGEHKTGDELETAARVYEQTFEYILLLYLPAVAGIVLLAEPGIRHIFGPDYLGAVPVLMVFSGFALFQAIDKITNDSLDYLGRGRERAIGKVSTAVLNFFLNLVLIPTIGIVGAALATVCSFGAMVLYNIYLMNTEVPLRISRMGRSVVRTAGIALLMALVVFVSGTYVDGVISLFATIATGVATWAVLSVLSGLIDPGRVLNHM